MSVRFHQAPSLGPDREANVSHVRRARVERDEVDAIGINDGVCRLGIFREPIMSALIGLVSSMCTTTSSKGRMEPDGGARRRLSRNDKGLEEAPLAL